MHPFIAKLTTNGPILVDGGWGTQLNQLGLPAGSSPELWNASHPQAITEVARRYAAAGSRIVLTNSFGGSRIRLAECGAGDNAKELNYQAAALSCDGCEAFDDVHVFGSIGPCGKMVMMGEVAISQLEDAFMEQAESLVAGGVAGFVIETMADLEEATAAVRVCKTTGLPVVACMVYDTGPNYDFTMMGVTPESASTELVNAGADVIGANCGVGIDRYADICRRLKQSGVPVWAKPNAGMPEVVNGETVFRTTAQAFADHAPALLATGIDFIGGCCGTSPEFITALARTLAHSTPASISP